MVLPYGANKTSLLGHCFCCLEHEKKLKWKNWKIKNRKRSPKKVGKSHPESRKKSPRKKKKVTKDVTKLLLIETPVKVQDLFMPFLILVCQLKKFVL